MTPKFLFFISLSATSIGVFAQGGNPNQEQVARDVQLNTITTAVPFLLINPDSRAGGMGEIGAATSADMYSIYWNTSKLAFAKEKMGFSTSYSPWLRAIAQDMHLSFVTGFYKINDRQAVTASLRYFSLGQITFTDASANKIRDFVPSEFETMVGYALKLSDKMALGMNGKFVFSNLTGGTLVAGANTRPATAGAADVSFSYFDDELRVFGNRALLGIGVVLSNIGNKVSYTNAQGPRDFLPANLRFGSALSLDLDEYNRFTLGVDFNKLLVPTPPIRVNGPNNSSYSVGMDNNVAVIAGIFQSFYDAPGRPLIGADNNPVIENGEVQVKKGSRFGEELREINFGIGTEYVYNKTIAVRAGYFHEHYSKGNRRYLTFGIGLKYSKLGIDLSYIASLVQQNPLANTLRFSLSIVIDNNSRKRDKIED
jgi:hypothetical protein